MEEPLVDFFDEPDPELNQLTNLIIGSAIAVHRELGAGYAESIYGKALALGFAARGIQFVAEHPVHVMYRETLVGEGRVDFFVFDKIIVKLKAVESLAPIHSAQMISYLKAMKCRLGLIINFNVRLLKDGVKRIAN